MGGARPPELLTQQDLWSAARVSPPSLLFRVRTESDPGAALSKDDRLESCIGLLDANVRWRCTFNLTRTAINALRHPVLAKACLDVMQFVSMQHPANISPAQRQAFIQGITEAAGTQMEGVPEPVDFEKHVAMSVAALAQADNDIEAAHLVPFWRAMVPFEQHSNEFIARVATVETLAGAALLTEAANRLSERAPAWHFAEMPSLGGDEKGGEEEEDDEQ